MPLLGMINQIKSKSQMIKDTQSKKKPTKSKNIKQTKTKATKKSVKTQDTKTDMSGKNAIKERSGFGWKGLGARKILFDKNIKEYQRISI